MELTLDGTEHLRIAAPVFDRELDRLLRAPLPGTALTQMADALSTLRRSAATQAASPAAGGASNAKLGAPRTTGATASAVRPGGHGTTSSDVPPFRSHRVRTPVMPSPEDSPAGCRGDLNSDQGRGRGGGLRAGGRSHGGRRSGSGRDAGGGRFAGWGAFVYVTGKAGTNEISQYASLGSGAPRPLAAAYGGGPASVPEPSNPVYRQYHAYSLCMRTHGAPFWPEPTAVAHGVFDPPYAYVIPSESWLRSTAGAGRRHCGTAPRWRSRGRRSPQRR